MDPDTFYLMLFAALWALYVVIGIVVIHCLRHKRAPKGKIPSDKCNVLKNFYQD